jgi:hypothetical protein
MVKSGLEFFILKKIGPERLTWPDRIEGISEDLVQFQNKKILDHFLPSFLS